MSITKRVLKVPTITATSGGQIFIFDFDISRSGQYLVTASGRICSDDPSTVVDNTIAVWDLFSGCDTCKMSFHNAHKDMIFGVCYTRREQFFLSVSLDGAIRGGFPTTPHRYLPIRLEYVTSMQPTPDDVFLFLGCDNGNITILPACFYERDYIPWGPERRIRVCRRLHREAISQIKFTSDGQRVLTASRDRLVRVHAVRWLTDTGVPELETLLTLKGHRSWVRCASFSPNERWIVSGSDDCTVRVWDAETGAQTRVLKGHLKTVTSVGFSPDERLVVSSSMDGSVRLWDADHDEASLVLKNHRGPVKKAIFFRDGYKIISSAADGTVRVEDLTHWRIFCAVCVPLSSQGLPRPLIYLIVSFVAESPHKSPAF